MPACNIGSHQHLPYAKVASGFRDMPWPWISCFTKLWAYCLLMPPDVYGIEFLAFRSIVAFIIVHRCLLAWLSTRCFWVLTLVGQVWRGTCNSCSQDATDPTWRLASRRRSRCPLPANLRC